MLKNGSETSSEASLQDDRSWKTDVSSDLDPENTWVCGEKQLFVDFSAKDFKIYNGEHISRSIVDHLHKGTSDVRVAIYVRETDTIEIRMVNIIAIQETKRGRLFTGKVHDGRIHRYPEFAGRVQNDDVVIFESKDVWSPFRQPSDRYSVDLR